MARKDLGPSILLPAYTTRCTHINGCLLLVRAFESQQQIRGDIIRGLVHIICENNNWQRRPPLNLAATQISRALRGVCQQFLELLIRSRTTHTKLSLSCKIFCIIYCGGGLLLVGDTKHTRTESAQLHNAFECPQHLHACLKIHYRHTYWQSILFGRKNGRGRGFSIKQKISIAVKLYEVRANKVIFLHIRVREY
jgi:hypothetical protein